MRAEDLENMFNQMIGKNDLEINKQLDRMVAGLNGNEIKDVIEPPKPGQKVYITDYMNKPSSLVAKLARQKYCIVSEVSSIPIGENGDYHFEYDIYVEGGENYLFPTGTYKILTEKEIKILENNGKIY